VIRLQTVLGISLSEKIRNISPIQLEPIHIKNKTLGGENHVQTIGTPLKFITFEALSNQTQVDMINENWAAGAKFKFVDGGTSYTGLIDELPQWERITPRYSNPTARKFTALIKLYFKEAGTP
jgi:hypothetical protein